MMQAVPSDYRFLVSLRPELINDPDEADGCCTNDKIKLIAIPCILLGAAILGLTISAHLPAFFYGIAAIVGVLGLIPFVIDLSSKPEPDKVLCFTPNHHQVVPFHEEQLQGQPEVDINKLVTWFDEAYPQERRSIEMIRSRQKLETLIEGIREPGKEEELSLLRNICAYLENHPYSRGRVIKIIADAVSCAPTVTRWLRKTYKELTTTSDNLIKELIQQSKERLILDQYQQYLGFSEWHVLHLISRWYGEEFGLDYREAMNDPMVIPLYCIYVFFLPSILLNFRSWFLEAWTEEVAITSLAAQYNFKLRGDYKLGNDIVDMLKECLNCVPEDAHVDPYEWLQERGFLEFENVPQLVRQVEAWGGGLEEHDMQTVTSISHKTAIILLMRVGIIADDDELRQRILDDSGIEPSGIKGNYDEIPQYSPTHDDSKSGDPETELTSA